MADFTITIPGAHVNRVRNALCARIGKTAPADQTLVNARAGLALVVRQVVRDYEAGLAEAAAAAAVAADVVDVT